ncbi:hypothetical protein R6Q57_020147 [Mikania cordata]
MQTIPLQWVQNHYRGEQPPDYVLLKSHDCSTWKVKVVKINKIYSLESGLQSLIKHMRAKKLDILVFRPVEQNTWYVNLIPYTESQRKLEPVFYHILLDTEDASCQLKLVFDKEPPKVNVPKQWVTLEVKDGLKFRVKVVKDERCYKISDGWTYVLRDIPLRWGDFIAFFLIDPDTIHMIPFMPDGIELICPKKEIQDSEYIVIDEDEVVDSDDNNAEADEVHKIFTKIATSRFRLPIHVARIAGLDQNNEMRFVDLSGQESTVVVRSEMSGNYKRYTIHAAFWKDFMKKNTIAQGDNCTFDYNILDHTLSFVRVDKV